MDCLNRNRYTESVVPCAGYDSGKIYNTGNNTDVVITYTLPSNTYATAVKFTGSANGSSAVAAWFDEYLYVDGVQVDTLSMSTTQKGKRITDSKTYTPGTPIPPGSEIELVLKHIADGWTGSPYGHYAQLEVTRETRERKTVLNGTY